MYTNIPTELVSKSIERRWNLMENKTSIPLHEFIKAIMIIIHSTFFSFDNKIFKQIFGMPMGSPLSPILANIVLQDFEQEIITKNNINSSFYFRYVDDIVLAIHKEKVEGVLELFNSYHERLKFTVDFGDDNGIHFLDVKLMRQEGNIIFDIYKKPTNSGRYLNYFSNHPLEHKRGVIIGQFDRILFLSHPIFHEKNISELIHTFLSNGYPLKFIFSTINNRIKTLENRTNLDQNRKEINNECDSNVTSKKFFTIPYLGKVSEKFKKLSHVYGFNIAYKPMNKLNTFIKTGKDSLPKDDQCGVVYKINCLNCESSYVGQTKRKLKTRIKEHKADIRKPSSEISVVSRHRMNEMHELDWDNIRILDIEQSLAKRRISEMIHIKRQTSGINKQSDTEGLPEVYFPLLKKDVSFC